MQNIEKDDIETEEWKGRERGGEEKERGREKEREKEREREREIEREKDWCNASVSCKFNQGTVKTDFLVSSQATLLK